MSDSAEINRLLAERLPEICEMLLPGGKQIGNHYVVGGIDGGNGASMQVTIAGAAAGRFKDFANPEEKGGTPLFLWSRAKKIPFKQAVQEAKDWLGIKEDDYGVKKHRNKEYAKPAPHWTAVRTPEPNTDVMDYLCSERRLDPIVVASARLGESEDGKWIVIPYYDKDESQPFHCKRLALERPNGKKQIVASKDTRRGLFGKHLIDDDVAELTITEGEFDALSYQSWGLPSVSMPNGVSDESWIEIEWEWLARFQRINLSCDMDEPGLLAMQSLCKRLGLHRTFIVTLPHKDANECLMKGVTRADIEKCLAEAKSIELEEIKRPDEYSEEVHDYYTTDWSKRGWDTPWYPYLPWRVRKAEFTILTGFSGSGKTVALNQLMLHLVQQGCRVMDASLEIKPGMTLYNMTRCALGKKTSSREEIDGCISWLNDSVFFLDCIGTVNVKRLLAAMEYARKRHGIDVFVIDSLFKCGLDPTDYGAQRTFADALTSFCNNTGAHVILVAHARKTQNGNEFSVPSKSDVSGSSDLTNAAFNVIVWWRNKLKKRKIDEAKQKTPPDNAEIDKWLAEPDGKAVLDKQRFGEGEEAELNVFFQSESFQFHPKRFQKTHYYQQK
jgi:twinkle protein